LLLPEAGAALIGEDHPFLEETVRDLVALCAHPDAGDLVISGWRKGAAPYSFRQENGAHAGPGPEETHAFALLPADTPLPELAKSYLRPLDLRHAALTVLDRLQPDASTVPGTAPGGRRREPGVLRLMTYNVHSCIGMDGRSSPERIARVIAQYEPDVVALQELDVGRARTGVVDQAHEIAHRLEMEYHFHAALRVAEEEYGNAILTHLPMRMVRAEPLSGLPQYEPRGALWVAIDTGNTEIQVITTHLSLWPKERGLQAAALAGKDWLGHPDFRFPAILLGDLNAVPGSAAYRTFCSRLRDAQGVVPGHRPRKTLFGRYPSARIDHVFLHPDLQALSVEVPRTQLSRIASDHLPLIVDIHVPPPDVPSIQCPATRSIEDPISRS
jgi:endonuclease/exonuclease/phosphatase family metal-dependent hydrolase